MDAPGVDVLRVLRREPDRTETLQAALSHRDAGAPREGFGSCGEILRAPGAPLLEGGAQKAASAERSTWLSESRCWTA